MHIAFLFNDGSPVMPPNTWAHQSATIYLFIFSFPPRFIFSRIGPHRRRRHHLPHARDALQLLAGAATAVAAAGEPDGAAVRGRGGSVSAGVAADLAEPGLQLRRVDVGHAVAAAVDTPPPAPPAVPGLGGQLAVARAGGRVRDLGVRGLRLAGRRGRSSSGADMRERSVVEASAGVPWSWARGRGGASACASHGEMRAGRDSGASSVGAEEGNTERCGSSD